MCIRRGKPEIEGKNRGNLFANEPLGIGVTLPSKRGRTIGDMGVSKGLRTIIGRSWGDRCTRHGKRILKKRKG